MRIQISTLGSRGDVQPFLALAGWLQQAGHTVQVSGPATFAALAAATGAAFAPQPASLIDLLATPAGAATVGGRRPDAAVRLLKHARQLLLQVFDFEWRTAQAFGPDLIVHHPKVLAAPHIAEKLGADVVLASPVPGLTPTAAFPSPLWPLPPLGPLNRLSHSLFVHAARVPFAGDLGRWRRTVLGLSPGPAFPTKPRTLYAYSPAVLPRPKDWEDQVCVAGYWFLDEPWRPSPELAAFLRQGEPPVYVGFGSMPADDPTKLTAAVVEALRRTGRRGVLATGGGALTRIPAPPPHIHVLDAAAHASLFPHVSAVIHHGGAGVTGASLRAGRPMVICPFVGDQMFWARRAYELGVAPSPLDPRRLTADALAKALRSACRPKAQGAAERLAAQIAGEDGLARAEAFLGARPRA